MRLVRYRLGGQTRRGAVVGELVHELSDGVPGRVAGTLGDVQLLAPCEPRVIVCAGSNYADQIAEKGRPWPDRPSLFLKAPNAIVGPGAEILRPVEVRRLEYEGELAVVVGRTARGVRADRAADFVLGYTCANDVTAHDWRADGQWTRAKSADTFCPLGPWIETEPPDPPAMRITTRRRGEVVQRGSVADMVFGIGELLAFVTRWITLEPGDVLLTGSPAGVGPMAPGDDVEVEISGIGTLRNVVAERP
ncbi:2-keto-4-pentenoate hydratase/2-oxohepta-3-ene-1,7-dioic acid hydratase (catechol pathway) [Saccharopolyspora kobensis]|uniref:2-keto-4-pentenoate hydratase/2-oxohepta-3-ene-1,7-dioic acid hydratase (Catechol pathway) n=1 Tax=Saccharopolyspora kobensis TaxID=146035 RepID=A0A1H5ZVL2_9PSEU|nr:fumarylacetoacetate hydrolase family protein [Saccharopolyspora kobensis]SEG40538.1 2-keto-4-pentenoate hydratase/2-oxohepta-3-ene-1,7-dioic acid hydratase (catechol pathway) [Saccharopolyspora kobensis]SFE15286.1 2-keto-4-pentenoate hydratase/2-oxohepta-3-ene-1,7-dioic acid hydratase (catechol pathway) [Saccharopolyspora kobensis]